MDLRSIGNVNISVLNGVLWDMEQVHYGICKIGNLITLVNLELII